MFGVESRRAHQMHGSVLFDLGIRAVCCVAGVVDLLVIGESSTEGPKLFLSLESWLREWRGRRTCSGADGARDQLIAKTWAMLFTEQRNRIITQSEQNKKE